VIGLIDGIAVGIDDIAEIPGFGVGEAKWQHDHEPQSATVTKIQWIQVCLFARLMLNEIF
jgi:hypothetical protein